MEALLRAREQAMGQSVQSDLFTEDGMILDLSNPTRWVRGRAAVQDMLSRFISASFRYHPNAFRIDGSTGYIAGTVAIRQGEADRHVLNFIMGLVKGPDGKWRIGAESTTVKTPPDNREPYTAEKVLEELDVAGIKRALVLSDAYKIGGGWQQAARDEHAEYAAVKAENDWAVAEAARYPDRLVPFCSVNPLKDYALLEVERCATIPGVKGFKLHFDDSKVDLVQPQHLKKVRLFFRAANKHGLAIAVHLSHRMGEYGRRYSEIFLKEVLPLASDIPIQIMHMAGDTGYPAKTDEALGVFADAIAAGDTRTKSLYFEVGGIVTPSEPDAVGDLVVKRMRQIGLNRIVFGSDGLPSPPPAQAWALFKQELPLTDEEVRQVANNVAPYMR